MLTYNELKEQLRKFVSFAGLMPKEFNVFLPALEQAYSKSIQRQWAKRDKCADTCAKHLIRYCSARGNS